MKKELEAADTSEEMSANILNNKISIDAREFIIEKYYRYFEKRF